MKIASIFWCTGMSGVGKSTLSEYAKSELENHGYNILILDGDVERENYDIRDLSEELSEIESKMSKLGI